MMAGMSKMALLTWRGVQSCWPCALISLCCSLGFLAAWWLGSKKKQTQKQRRSHKDISWLNLGSHTASPATFYSQALSRPKGRGNRLHLLTGGRGKSHVTWSCRRWDIVAAIFGNVIHHSLPQATKIHIHPSCNKPTHFLPPKSHPIPSSDSGSRSRILPSSKSASMLMSLLGVALSEQRPLN